MGEVRLLQVNAALAPSPEDQAAQLERLAARVREGDIAFDKAVLVWADPRDGRTTYHAFGQRMNYAELVGLLEYAKFAALTTEA